ncbi:MAG TPA: O-antigen ligase family protein [Verrucomicrobiae bacterium]|nr:O-antigen ligase family protein [Verrucomicrobiae bacterium]
MNFAGYCLGMLLLTKLSIRQRTAYRPPRWTAAETGRQSEHRTVLTFCLGLLTLALLGFCLASALNARATFRNDTLSFEYHDCWMWLPHSLDSGGTWFAFWTYLGLACSFWSIRDWLQGKSNSEERAQWQKTGAALNHSPPAGFLPERLRRLLWLLALNGALLSIEAIVQRMEKSPKLLFLVLPRIHQTAETQFGAYAYRANAAQYFNLLWPMCVGFWWTISRNTGRQSPGRQALLLCTAVMAAAPLVSSSRAGAAVTLGMLGVSALSVAGYFLGGRFQLGRCGACNVRRGSRRRAPGVGGLAKDTTAWLCFFVVVVPLVGLGLGWKALGPRLERVRGDFAARKALWEAARPMTRDYPVFGTGPGTFETVSQLYARPAELFWPRQLHNDWLEMRITFGWVGSVLIVLALVAIGLRCFAPGAGLLGLLIGLALAGCLAHARLDFPFQVYSILFLFVLECAVLFCSKSRHCPASAQKG